MFEDLSPNLAALGLVAGAALGFLARRGRFCTLAAIEDTIYAADLRRVVRREHVHDRPAALVIALALAEVRRVLKPGGRFLLVEHGRAPDHDVARWQDRLTPLWKPIAGGCHLNRAMDALVSEAGFRIDDLRCGYMRGPRSFSFMYEGYAAALQPTTYDRIMNGDA